eukprot:gene38634-15935_t
MRPLTAITLVAIPATAAPEARCAPTRHLHPDKRDRYGGVDPLATGAAAIR